MFPAQAFRHRRSGTGVPAQAFRHSVPAQAFRAQNRAGRPGGATRYRQGGGTHRMTQVPAGLDAGQLEPSEPAAEGKQRPGAGYLALLRATGSGSVLRDGHGRPRPDGDVRARHGAAGSRPYRPLRPGRPGVRSWLHRLRHRGTSGRQARRQVRAAAGAPAARRRLRPQLPRVRHLRRSCARRSGS